MKKSVISFIMSMFATYFFSCVNVFGASDNAVVDPPHWKEASVACLIGIGIFVALIFWLKSSMEKRSKKDRIIQLKLLSRILYDSFNNLVKEGGLLEEAWSFVSKEDGEGDKKFRNMLKRTQDVMKKERMEERLRVFERRVTRILNEKEDVKNDSLYRKYEDMGFAVITILIGSNISEKEFDELNSLLHVISRKCAAVVENDLALRFDSNRVDVSPFEYLLERNRNRLLSQSDLKERPGLLRYIENMSLAIREKVSYGCIIRQ